MIHALTNHLLQSTLFAIFASLLTLALRKNRAHVRYWVWLTASLKFLVPFALLMSLGSALETWFPAAHHLAEQIKTPAVTSTVEQFGEPLLLEVRPLPNAATIDWVPVAILGVWLCGFAAIASARLRNWLRIQAAVRTGNVIDLNAATVEVRITPGLLEPGVVGLLKPVLLLPEGILERLSASELEAVLAHELCHVRRRDNLFASIHMFVEAVFWFHPFVWWIGARLVEERERACDEEVLNQGNRPEVYADAILNVCKLYTESPLACVSGVTGASIKRRIEAIMSNRRMAALNPAKKFLLAAAGLAALVGPVATGLIIGVGNAPVIRAQSPTPAAPQAPPTPIQATAPTVQPTVAAIQKFDVASIRPCDPNEVPPGGRGGGRADTRYRVDCQNVMTLIERAYMRFADGKNRSPMSTVFTKIIGGPAWISSDLYTIEAESESTQTRMTMDGPMMQALLEDRFQLRVHRETREGPVYLLTVAKSDSGLQAAKPGGCVASDFMGAPFDRAIFLSQPDRQCSFLFNVRKGPNTIIAARSVGIDNLTAALTRMTDRLVIDKTGITGLVDFRLLFAPDETTPGPAAPRAIDEQPMADDPAGPSIFTALRQQLGLKLESGRGPREFLVIDSIQRPSAN